MVIFPGLSQPLRSVGKRIAAWDAAGTRLVVMVGSVVRQACCPRCARRSSRLHGCYRRWVADSPCFGQPVTLEVEIRRFKCVNRRCPQRTFSERIDALVAPRQRRTLRLGAMLRAVGYALGGAAAARLAARLGMRISDDTILRELRRARPAPLAAAPVAVGIDDWAMARGHRYSTIVVDLQRHCPIALLPGRDATNVTSWLQVQPAVEVVARDRAGAYADAARTAAPNAVQVADRWHLLRNLRDALERLLLRCTVKLRQAALVASEEIRAQDSAASVPHAASDSLPAATPPATAARRHVVERRAHRLARYEEVVRRHRLGESISAIGRAVGLDRHTVRGFVRAGAFPERAPRAAVPTLLDAHRPRLAVHATDACHSAARIWRELQADGFTGSYSTVRAAVARMRGTAEGSNIGRTMSATVRPIAPPSPRRACAWLMGWAERKLGDSERNDRRCFVEALCHSEPAIAIARSLAQRLFGLVRDRDVGGFDRWLAQARTCAVIEMRRFAAGLESDLPAVRAAFTTSWSSGQVEGHINRLKFPKRQMYGRAKLDLLRIRVLHPN